MRWGNPYSSTLPPNPMDRMLSDRLKQLTDYPFARLASLLDGVAAPVDRETIDLSIGGPRHAAPEILVRTIAAHADAWNRYPPALGTDDLRQSIVDWLGRRYRLPRGRLDPRENVQPVSGTREALFAAGLVTVPDAKAGQPPAVAFPNPYYAVYRGAALMAGAEPVPLDATGGSLPEPGSVPAALRDRLALVYLCSPANPQGTMASLPLLGDWIAAARQHGFVLAVDETYAEIYDRAPPPGALEAAATVDGGALDNLLVFPSLSKRSNAAGLRSGFIAGGDRLVAGFRRLRGYGAAGVPLPVQAASAALWRDEAHVEENRRLYRAKIDLAERLLAGRFGFYRPPGGFFLWLDVGNGEAAARHLWARAGVRALPGPYLAAGPNGGPSPGDRHLRIALVPPQAELADGLTRLADALQTLSIDTMPEALP